MKMDEQSHQRNFCPKRPYKCYLGCGETVSVCDRELHENEYCMRRIRQCTLGCGKIVGTLSGFAGMAAKLGAAGLTILVTFITTGGNYTPAFLIGGALAIIALLAVWLLCPKIEPLKAKK